MCLITDLMAEEPRGPYGSLRSGDGSVPAEHAPWFKQLAAEQKDAVKAVWAGRARRILIYRPETHELKLVEHSASGSARSGRRYGYTDRTVVLPAPAMRRGRRVLRALGLLLVLTAGSAAVVLAALR